MLDATYSAYASAVRCRQADMARARCRHYTTSVKCPRGEARRFRNIEPPTLSPAAYRPPSDARPAPHAWPMPRRRRARLGQWRVVMTPPRYLAHAADGTNAASTQYADLFHDRAHAIDFIACYQRRLLGEKASGCAPALTVDNDWPAFERYYQISMTPFIWRRPVTIAFTPHHSP